MTGVNASVISALIGVTGPALADTLTCSTFTAVRTCLGDHGYRSTESQWQGRTFGQDSDGNRWTTSRWRDIETSTVEPPPER
jgi:hypothetical protein